MGMYGDSKDDDLDGTMPFDPRQTEPEDVFKDVVAKPESAREKYAFLYALWREAWPASRAAISDELFEKLAARYAENHRAYHTFEHIEEFGRQFRKHEGQFPEDKRALILALFYHDSVYNAAPGHDEVASIAIMRAECTGFFSPSILNRSERLIRYTIDHGAPAHDRPAWLFIDMDMSILGSAPGRYARYASSVMREFTHTKYTEKEFCLGRQVFLHKTLDQNNTTPIFKTPEYAPLEVQARVNMRAELARLQAHKAELDLKP